jgi:NADP oxidoreductase coenzyme F420-dependent
VQLRSFAIFSEGTGGVLQSACSRSARAAPCRVRHHSLNRAPAAIAPPQRRNTNMGTISVIGSGGMTAAIGGRAAKAGHTVEVISRDPAKARALAEKLSAGAITGTYGAAPAGDIVILAVPYASAAGAVTKYRDARGSGTLGSTPQRARRLSAPDSRQTSRGLGWPL